MTVLSIRSLRHVATPPYSAKMAFEKVKTLTFRSTLIGCGFIFVLFWEPAFASAGEIYRWSDEKGTVHFTDDLSKVPKPYLDQVEKKGVPEERSEKRKVPEEASKKEESLPQSEGKERPDRVKEYLKDIENKIAAKKELEKRIAQLEEELKQCEDRLKKIEERAREYPESFYSTYDPSTKKWVITSPEYEEKVRLTMRMKDIKEELRSLQEKLSMINRSL
jgi:hypothetical protein